MVDLTFFHPDYEPIEILGRGGMGTVYSALDSKLQRKVAVKHLHSAYPIQEVAALLQQEARTGARLSHPGIATIFGFEVHEGHAFLIMELVEGRTLADHSSERKFDVSETIDLIGQIADALEHAHYQGEA